MKRFFVSNWMYIVLLLGSFACEEVPVQINRAAEQGECATVNISDLEQQERNVLIEEFTGVQCVNCPDGSKAIEELIAQYGDRIVVTSLHAGFFSDPFPESRFDLRTNVGDALLDFLGSPLGYPAAIVNRKNFNNSPRLHLGRSSWAGAIATDLAEEPEIKIGLESTFDAASREAVLNISLLFDVAQESPTRLSVFITEDVVVDYQETPSGVQSDYVHNHVLRHSLTGFTGDLIQEDTGAGSFFCKQLKTTLPQAWKIEDCKFVVFVHQGGDQRIILQANAIKIDN